MHVTKASKMTKLKSLNKEATNFKNKGQRIKLYNRTLLKHNFESRIFTLQNEALKLATISTSVAINTDKRNLFKLAEQIGAIEVIIEVVKLSVPKLSELSTESKYDDLSSLKRRADKAYEDLKKGKETAEKDQYTENSKDTLKAIDDFTKAVPEKRSILGFVKHCLKY